MTQPIEHAIERLENLSVIQFKKVLLYYQVSKSEIPDAGARGEKAIAVVEYARQKEGEQLTDLFKVINEVAPQKNQIMNVDTLRFHLPNRRTQESKLGRAIKTHHNKHRPLVCLIHSDETQCSDRFVKRLAKHYIPRLKISKENISSHYVPCKLNENIDLQEELSEQLASKLGLNPFATRSEIVQAIVSEGSPIIFSTDMCTNNWSRCGEIQLIHNFIDFWANLEIPETHSHLILVCIYFNYKEIRITNFFKRWFEKTFINNKIRQAFIQLEQENCVILPELMNIEKDDVEKWAREHLDGNVLDRVRPKINDLFSDYETMAMCDLANKLREILEDFSPDVFNS